ncbi:MAG: response regulator, partial [Phycisphaerae bacterium]|nr:response regulator [Phycisphaerae bacterium]NIW98812.1 response regulator [Phycisphaerae bacterium]NIX30759.1 response regulator [Phycisphaerae bacterium]
ITDLKMPNMDGFELIRHLRNDAKTELLPIIMLTGESDDKSREEARKVGVSAFIVKPFVPEQISGLIRSIFT